MKTYLVGGAVRDSICYRTPDDHDYVIVGATESDVCELMARGFKQVGRDFPVFLYEGCEYALARVERKHGVGHNGFSAETQHVSLEEDLSRRDLTINAMAQDLETGEIIDPYNGQKDLMHRMLRHVSVAFSEDPLRIFRVARFAARYEDFTVAQETMVLMQNMVDSGDLKSLSGERVWAETIKAIQYSRPSRYFEILDQCGALKVWFPELDALKGVEQPILHHPEGDAYIHTMMVLDRAAALRLSAAERVAALFHDIGKGQTPRDQWPSHRLHNVMGGRMMDVVQSRFHLSNEDAALAKL